MKSLKTMPKLLLAGDIARSSLSIVSLNRGAEFISITKTMNKVTEEPSVIFREDSFPGRGEYLTKSIKKGTTFAIQLEESDRPGVVFTLDPAYKHISLITNYRSNEGNRKHTFVFKADSLGMTDIILLSSKPGDPYRLEFKYKIRINVVD
ncbi:hypothetical protein ABEZ87_03995 [Bacillus mycoides]|uniref:hypothetical protein n=1 Tax=Bacillus mycoides TaxID=1405 RepID=UPI003D2095EB